MQSIACTYSTNKQCSTKCRTWSICACYANNCQHKMYMLHSLPPPPPFNPQTPMSPTFDVRNYNRNSPIDQNRTPQTLQMSNFMDVTTPPFTESVYVYTGAKKNISKCFVIFALLFVTVLTLITHVSSLFFSPIKSVCVLNFRNFHGALYD